MNISVCMATYNGEEYVLKQVMSIINQLSSNDELIIIDDCSIDNTVKLINNLKDNRIKIYQNNTNKGHVYSFAKSIQYSSKDYIFLSDQDDIWVKGRVELMKNTLYNSNKMLLTSNYEFIDERDNKIFLSRPKKSSKDSNKYIKNIFSIFKGKSGYVGCCMSFPKKLKEIVLPIPSYVESHDLWIALASNLMKSNIHIDDITLKRRIHEKNASLLKRNLIRKLWSRVIFIISVIVLYVRIIKFKIKNW